MVTAANTNGAVSQADIAFEALRDMLVSLEIPPGAPVIESAIMESVGVGRTPVREALTRLETEQLVTIYPRRGTFAAEINIADLALITDLREELEGHAAHRAAQRATPADRSELIRLKDGDHHRETSEEAMALDTEIHHAIYAAAHNRFLRDTAVRYHNLSMRIWRLFTHRLPDLAGHIEEHTQLLGHIVDGDAEAARTTAAAHVRHFEAAVRALI